MAADWAPVAARIRAEATADLDEQVAVDRLVGKGGWFVRGWARLAGAGRVEVEVDGERFTARRGVVVAAGTAPAIPPIEGLASTPYWTNREAIEAKTLPGSLLVLGGGAVGLELAQVAARFGAAVTVVEALERLLPVEEPEASAVARAALEADGVTVHTGVRATRVGYEGGRFTAGLQEGTELHAEQLLVAVGRRASIERLGGTAVGLDPAAPAISTDGRMRAGEKLWAVGDVTGHGAFTHVATYQAQIAARDLLGEPGPPADHRAPGPVVTGVGEHSHGGFGAPTGRLTGDRTADRGAYPCP